jgi:hypothetical protein
MGNFYTWKRITIEKFPQNMMLGEAGSCAATQNMWCE